MTKLGILGDTHMDGSWVMYALNKFHREGITEIIQVGDFGIYGYMGGQLFLKRVNTKLQMYAQKLYVAPGNHEDYDYIESVPVQEDGWQHLRSNILLAPRNQRWEKDGKVFHFLGGAPSVDRHWRVNSRGAKSWWAQEAITQGDVDAAVEAGPADVMVAHDAPNGVRTIDKNIAGNPHGFKEWDLEYADEGRALMTEAFHGVQPKVFLHGHYHFPVDETIAVPSAPMLRDIKFTSHILGLHCNGHNHSLGEIDTETLDTKLWDIQQDYGDYLRGAV